MENILKSLISERDILKQSHEMYDKTRSEMIERNSSYSMIKSIENEMKSIDEKINVINNKIAEISTSGLMSNLFKEGDENVGSTYHDKYEMNETLPIDFNPLKNNHFILRFPNNFRINQYMIDSVFFNGNNLEIAIRESEGMYPILPVKLEDISKSEPFTMYIDILNSDGSVYYTQEFNECSSSILERPYLAYNDSGVRTWQINVCYKSSTYLTALPNIYPNEATN